MVYHCGIKKFDLGVKIAEKYDLGVETAGYNYSDILFLWYLC